MVKKTINKVAKKKIDKCCQLCGETNYSLLDVHRIIPGKHKGKYTEHNSLTTCCSCHRKIHAGQIVIDRKYFSTSGKWVVHFWENNQEKWSGL
jgi:hypothetical protein